MSFDVGKTFLFAQMMQIVRLFSKIYRLIRLVYSIYSAEKRDIFAIWSSHKMPVLNIIEHFFSNETISNKHVWNTARAYCFYSDNDVWEKKLPNFRQCKINWNIVKCPNIWIVLNFSNYTCHLHTLIHIQLFAFSGNDIVLMENK